MEFGNGDQRPWAWRTSAHVVEDTFPSPDTSGTDSWKWALACGDWTLTLRSVRQIDLKVTLARANDEKTYLYIYLISRKTWPASLRTNKPSYCCCCFSLLQSACAPSVMDAARLGLVVRTLQPTQISNWAQCLR
jgi:hypothetical protein